MKNYKAIAGNFKDYIRQTFKENGKAICIVLALQIVFSIGLEILYPFIGDFWYSSIINFWFLFEVFILMILLKNKNFGECTWKYMSVTLMCFCIGMLLMLIIGAISIVSSVILLWLEIMFNMTYIVNLFTGVMLFSVIITILVMLLLFYPYTRVCIFDCIKNNISAVDSIKKQLKLMISNKIVLIYIILSIIFIFGIGISETILVDINPLFRYIISVITPIANLINILVVHFIFTQLEAKYEVSQKESCSID